MLNDFRKLRNRVFHHEPIWNHSDLAATHQEMLNVAGWISPEMKLLLQTIDRFPAVYSQGVAHYENLLRGIWESPMTQRIPPLGRRRSAPDATAPDGSEIRFLVDRGPRGLPRQRGRSDPPCRTGLPPRPPPHRRGGLVHPGRRRTGLALPPGRRAGKRPALGCGPRGCPGHPHRVGLPVLRRRGRSPTIPLRDHASVARCGRGPARRERGPRPRYPLAFPLLSFPPSASGKLDESRPPGTGVPAD